MMIDWFYDLSSVEILAFVFIFLVIIFNSIAKCYGLKKKAIYLLTYVVMLIVAFVLTAFCIFPWHQIKKIEYLANKDLPRQLNEYTTLNKIKFNSQTVHYFYTFNDNGNEEAFAGLFDRPKEEVYDSEMIGTFCQILEKNPKLKEILVTDTYKGTSKEYTFDKTDCKKL